MDDIDETPLPEYRLAKAWYKFPYSGDDQKRAAVGDERSEDGGQNEQRHSGDAEPPRNGGEKFANCRAFTDHTCCREL